MNLEHLKAPFPADAIEWRIGQAGVGKNGKPWAKVLAYLDSRAVMDRLDEVCGPANWWDEYRPGPQGGVVCRLTIRTDAGPVSKEDGAENTDVEAVKGGISDALKRAAVKWGVGRYLYGLGDSWAECSTEKQSGDGWRFAKSKDGTFWWKPPALPSWALPSAAPASRPDAKAETKRRATEAAKGKVKPASEIEADYAKVVRARLYKVCGCENTEQANAVIYEVTGGVFTAIGELADPENAKEIHRLMGEYAEKPGNSLEGLALRQEVADAMGLNQ